MTKPKPRVVRLCAGCGDETTKRKWCSESCRNKWRYANSSEYRLSAKLRSKRNRPAEPLRYPKVCAWCGVTFEASSEHVRCCSTSCAAHLRYSGQTCPISPTQCSHCGLWRSRKGSGCGGCRRAPKVYTDAERVALMGARPCVQCGDEFVPTNLLAAVSGVLYCSVKCRVKKRNSTHKSARREAKHRRRARERNAYVAPVNRDEIFRRDGFVCLLCGDPLDMNAVVPDPLAPTIDHVIPIAKGGTHEPANVQAAHFLCNVLKSDKVEASATVAA